MREPVRERRLRVVGDLRQQAAEADAVRRRQRQRRLEQRIVAERAACTSDWQSSNEPATRKRMHVVAEAAELVRLARRDASVRIKNRRRGIRAGGGTPPRRRRRCRPMSRRAPSASAIPARGRRARHAARKRAPKSLNAAVGPWNSSNSHVRDSMARIGSAMSSDSAQMAGNSLASASPRKNGSSNPAASVAQRLAAAERIGAEQRQRFGHEQAAVRREPGRERGPSVSGSARAARAQVTHAMTSAAGPATGETQASLSRPAAANASRIARAQRRSRSASPSHHAKTLGPAPEMLAPSAPVSSAACLTAAKPGISARAARLDQHVVEPAADQLDVAACSSRRGARARFALCATNAAELIVAFERGARGTRLEHRMRMHEHAHRYRRHRNRNERDRRSRARDRRAASRRHCRRGGRRSRPTSPSSANG